MECRTCARQDDIQKPLELYPELCWGRGQNNLRKQNTSTIEIIS